MSAIAHCIILVLFNSLDLHSHCHCHSCTILINQFSVFRLIFHNVLDNLLTGAWLRSGRASDSESRGPGFDPNHVVSH